MDKEQITRAQDFAVKYIKENPVEINDTWAEFENQDLHFYFDEPDYPDDCGVYAYPLIYDEEGGIAGTDCDVGMKILNYDLTNSEEVL